MSDAPFDEIAWPSEFPLRKPIKAYGEEVTALKLAEPTGDHVLKHGVLEELNQSRILALITDLASVPESSVRAMDGRDLIKLSTIISRFFGQAARLSA
ncbi:phage tail assembly protein [Methylobacterium dankookense]|uniref:Phage tail protein E n=1 Tax=Methylobacterium dankookense TaxID=560405 RepID=A0A564G557_9HYPH|nr:phage tail assembly protein [Methylobacterium dankookense]GJD58356.1 hypothetical protein IFDJLNFL_4275 [Methylobacterium dankookense]VUF15639.1 hypothetical protein MTDSW087_05383 [Methylobacterium dankookense]